MGNRLTERYFVGMNLLRIWTFEDPPPFFIFPLFLNLPFVSSSFVKQILAQPPPFIHFLITQMQSQLNIPEQAQSLVQGAAPVSYVQVMVRSSKSLYNFAWFQKFVCFEII